MKLKDQSIKENALQILSTKKSYKELTIKFYAAIVERFKV